MSRDDRFDFTLDEETEKRLYDLLTDMDTRNTDRFWITDKHGYHAEYAKVIRCKDCKHMVEHKRYGYLGESAYTCEGNMGGWILPDSYCSRAERREECG